MRAKGKLTLVPVIRKSYETALPYTMVQAVVPFKGTSAPDVKVSSRALANGSVEVKVTTLCWMNVVAFEVDGKVRIYRIN